MIFYNIRVKIKQMKHTSEIEIENYFWRKKILRTDIIQLVEKEIKTKE